MKKKTWLIVGGVALALGLGYFIWTKSKKTDSKGKSFEDGFNDFDDDFDDESSSSSADPRYSYPVNPLLSKIENKKLASYLSNLLSQKDIYRLRSWLALINKERADDPTKWTGGQESRIAGALYQMKLQNKKDSKKRAQSKGEVWSTQIKTDLEDAQ